MSQTYNGPLDTVKDYGAGVLSGDMMSVSDKLQEAKSNVSFRINSAREMVTGLRGETSMTPMERRSEIRQRRLELLGVKSSNSSTSVDRTSPSPSGQIGERSRSTSRSTSRSDPSTKTGGSPLMSEVDKGTKARAEDRGFGT